MYSVFLIAVEAWLPQFNQTKEPLIKPNELITTSLASALPTLTLPPSLPLNENNVIDGENTLSMDSDKLLPIKKSTESMNDSSFQPITKELVNSLVTPPIILNPLEPMDCNASPALSPKHYTDAQMMEDQPTNSVRSDNSITSPPEPDNIQTNTATNCSVIKLSLDANKQDIPIIDSAEEMQTECSSNDFEEEDNKAPLNPDPSSHASPSQPSSAVHDKKTVTLEDVLLLVDFFYLPFEYGSQGVQFLNEFHWLKTNSYLISSARLNNSQPESPEILEWFERAKKFQEMTDTVERLCSRFVECKNLSLIYDLFPYIWDLRGAVSLLNSFVRWMCK